jgi:PAS domain S-box-containing protein
MSNSPYPDARDERRDLEARLRSFDWSKTPLGHIAFWSPTLRASVFGAGEGNGSGKEESLSRTHAQLQETNTEITTRLAILEAESLAKENQRIAALNLMEDALQSRGLAEKFSAESRQSEKRLSAFVAATSDVIYRMNADGSEMHQLDGKKYLAHSENSKGAWLSQYVDPGDQSRVLAIFKDAIRHKKAFEIEHRVPLADGTLGWSFSRAVPLFNTQGEIVEWFGAASNVTERKRAEVALRAGEERYRNLFNSIDEGVATIEVLFDQEGAPHDHRFLETNPAFEKNSGMVAPTGKLMSELRPGYGQYLNEIYGKVITTGKSVRFENRGGAVDRWLDIFVSRVGEAQNRRVAIIFTDITERKRVQEKLAEKARLLDLSNDAIIVRDLEDRISSWSKGAERLFGWTTDQVVGQHLDTLLHTKFPKPRAEILAQLQREGELTVELVQTTREGRIVPSLCRWVFDADTQSILTSSTDITARKAAEERMAEARDVAERANVSKDMFLAALSHELRTPLSPVLLLSGEAAENPAIPSATREIFATIVKNVKLEARLIDDLLDVTRITHRKLALDLTVVDVHVALLDAVETVQAEIEDKNIEVTQNFTKERVLMHGDPIRLQQIFWNVLRNAVKFSAIGAGIVIETRVLPSQVLAIRITDTGIGMTPEELLRLFEAFSQGDHAHGGGSHRFGGLGLGLSISRMLAELHAGTIRAESAGLDQGATFIIELPLSTEARLSAHPMLVRPTASSADSGERNSKSVCQRILLVEDHEPTRVALTHLLTRRNFEVVPVGTIAEATAAAGAAQFDLMISDLGLPDGSGLDLMAELRARCGLAGIALTGYGRDDDVARSREVGFVTHLTKPISIQALESAIASIANSQ